MESEGEERDNLQETRETNETGEKEDASRREEQHFEKAPELGDRNKDKDIEATRQKKGAIVEGMINKDFPVSQEKRDQSENFHYAGEKEFNQKLTDREPGISEKDRELISGFHDPRDNQAFVKETERGDTLATSLHEGLHQKSMSDLPTRFNEGLTEHYAQREAGASGNLKDIGPDGREIPRPNSDYEQEKTVIQKLESTVGEKPLQQAYFYGDTDSLKSEVDRVLGDGAYHRITDALESKDYQSANREIENFYKGK